MTTKLNAALIATATLATLGAGVASAGAPRASSEAADVVVRYQDLDLSNAAGIHRLYDRIQVAAWHVCLQLQYVRIENVRCRTSLTEDAVRAVNLPALSALHSAKRAPELSAQR